ncbi:MAG: LUD domain-containing protein [Porphyromonas sp.]|nr:LUD domain-containing protein [Porphyromonas sp.]
MNSKDAILQSLRENIKELFPKPEIKVSHIKFEDKVAQFKEIYQGVGGEVYELQEGESVSDAIKRIYPNVKSLACNMPEVTCATINPDDIDAPADLNGTELVVCKGIFGVCENGAIYYEQQYKQRAIYFISESLLFILPKSELVDTMHEAMSRISHKFTGEFRGFISGPSKTADIEQALVKGAHGAKESAVLLI